MRTPGLAEIVTLAEQAGSLIMGFYQRSGVATRDKSDGSPVTDADLAAEAFLRDELARRWSYPIVSEETPPPPYEERKHWPRHWLVDPLDGTRDFVGRTGEFCVNVALIEGDRPILGVVAAPALATVWCAELGGGARRIEGGSERRLRCERGEAPIVALKSRFHAGEDVERWYREHGITDVRACGSTIKLCRIAEGAADVYVSYSPSKEWDLAPGQLILEEAGGHLLELASRQPLKYHRPSLVNPPVIGCSARFFAAHGT